jgi:putative hemolysin
VSALTDVVPWLIAMGVLIGCSAFFSASEAALFYLRRADRRALMAGNPSQQVAAKLLDDPERLLSAVLFWNLMINIAYFTTASAASLRLERSEAGGSTMAFGFAVTSLLVIILLSEMLPKSLAVLGARRLSGLIAYPLAASVRTLDPVMPILRLANLLSRRLIWPGFETEKYLEVSDLDRAIDISTTNESLVEQERTVLRNIILLSDIRVDEWMRPRTQYMSFRPPVALADLEGQMTPSGYLLITEPDSEEVAAALHLKEMSEIPDEHLEHYGESVVVVPWCSTVAAALQEMKRKERQVAAVVNEFGETIGILTFEDVLDTIFNYNPSRSGRLLDRRAINPVQHGVWQVTGMTSLRQLSRMLNIELPARKSVTVAGVIQETLQRLAKAGDKCEWGPFHFRVLEAPERGQMLVELSERRERGDRG